MRASGFSASNLGAHPRKYFRPKQNREAVQLSAGPPFFIVNSILKLALLLPIVALVPRRVRLALKPVADALRRRLRGGA